MYLLQIIGLQENLQQAITQMGLDASKYAYVYQYVMEYDSTAQADREDKFNQDIGQRDLKSYEEDTLKEAKKSSSEALTAFVIDSAYFKAMLHFYLDENKINNSCIKGGISGIYTFMSDFMGDGDNIDIIISYSIKIPVPVLSIKEIPFLQRVRIRGFHGFIPENNENEAQEQDETYVYITETGSVYHLIKECSYLKLSIEEEDYNSIHNLRNESGGKYYPCSICIDKHAEISRDSVYITKSGDKYHSSLSCSGLKRTIFTVTIDQVGDKTLCSRCGKANKDKGAE